MGEGKGKEEASPRAKARQATGGPRKEKNRPPFPRNTPGGIGEVLPFENNAGVSWVSKAGLKGKTGEGGEKGKMYHGTGPRRFLKNTAYHGEREKRRHLGKEARRDRKHLFRGLAQTRNRRRLSSRCSTGAHAAGGGRRGVQSLPRFLPVTGGFGRK